MTFGIKKYDENRVTFETHIDDYVRIRTSGGSSYFGKMISTDYEYTILNPSLVDLTFFDNIECVMSKKNTIVTTKNISVIEPITENYLERLVKGFKNEKKKIKKQGRKRKWVKQERT